MCHPYTGKFNNKKIFYHEFTHEMWIGLLGEQAWRVWRSFDLLVPIFVITEDNHIVKFRMFRERILIR